LEAVNAVLAILWVLEMGDIEIYTLLLALRKGELFTRDLLTIDGDYWIKLSVRPFRKSSAQKLLLILITHRLLEGGSAVVCPTAEVRYPWDWGSKEKRRLA